MAILAKMCEKMEQFGDMCEVMHELVSLAVSSKNELTEDERALVATAFKNQAGRLRSACRVPWTEDQFADVMDEYTKHLHQELTKFCDRSLDLFASMSKSPSLSTEGSVFAIKLQADFHRYMAETSPGGRDSRHSKTALSFYQEAMELAESKLEATHPLRLGVSLNCAVCYHEIFKNTKQACQLAKTAFNKSIALLDSVDDDQYQDSTLLMQLLRDNLTLWTTETDSSK